MLPGNAMLLCSHKLSHHKNEGDFESSLKILAHLAGEKQKTIIPSRQYTQRVVAKVSESESTR